jgi:SAM-dependent methyltransferase
MLSTIRRGEPVPIPDWLSGRLACPHCRLPLEALPDVWRCPACALALPSPADRSMDLRGAFEPDEDWRIRQRHMERDYGQLLDDGDHAARGFENDYGAIASILRECEGRILDVGGGIGVTRHWLADDREYVLLEPSDIWQDARWQQWAGRFPCLARQPLHLRAFAEALPFSSGTFDAVLHLWTLNHVADAPRSIREGLRVLRPGGRLVAVLEEARPTWGDAWRASAGRSAAGRMAAVAAAAARRASPLQPDHAPVDERLLTRAAGVRVRLRQWAGPYLAIVVESA